MPNLDLRINQNEDITTNTINNFENHLLSIKTERQNMIHPNSHPTYNERQQKIIEFIDWSLEKYKTNNENTQQNEQVIINNIIEELYKKKNSYKQKAKSFTKR